MNKEPKEMKKVLMVSYSFPPKGGGGVLRQLKFAKYLPQFNWQPFILTGVRHYYFQDEELLKDLPRACRVYRIPYPDPRNLFSRRSKSEYSFIDKSSCLKPESSFKSILISIAKYMLSYFKVLVNQLLIPDIYIIWIPISLFRALRILQKEKINLIYSIDNPCSNHVLALVLKLFTGKPWIADFKDPWVRSFKHENTHLPPLSWVDNFLLKAVLRYCDVCVSSDNRLDKMFKKHISKNRHQKFIVIPNGFDSDDFKGDPPSINQNCLTITHVGIIYEDMPPDIFLCAVLNLIESGRIAEKNIKIIFAGAHGCLKTFAYPVYQLLLKRGIIEEKGFVSHSESIKYMRGSGALLLMSAKVTDSGQVVPSKVYEYLAARRPIIALVDEHSFCADLIRRSNSGYIMPIDDEEKIKKVILDFCSKFSSNGGSETFQNTGYFNAYERKNITHRLAGIMDSLNENYLVRGYREF